MKISQHLICIVLLGSLGVLQAARRVDIKDRMTRGLKQYQTSRLSRTLNDAPPQPDEILGLQNGEHLEPTEEAITAKGSIKLKYQETYQGVEVIGESVVIENELDGDYTGDIHGKLIEGIEEDVPNVFPSLTCWEALVIAVENEKDDVNSIHHYDCKLKLWVQEYDTDAIDMFLVYKVCYKLEIPGKASKPVYIIDAHSGSIIASWQGIENSVLRRQRMHRRLNLLKASTLSRRERYIEHPAVYWNDKVNGPSVKRQLVSNSLEEVSSVGGNEKVGKITYGGEEYPGLQVTNHGNGWCSLENGQVKVLSMNTTTSMDKATDENGTVIAYYFKCIEGIHDSVNGGFSPLSDAYYYLNVVNDMYNDWYDMSPLKSGLIIGRVHYDEQYQNAFWDGTYMSFGDGNETTHPLVSLDVTAHEISHGFTTDHADFMYIGQSGALHEAFSDMAGVTAQTYLHGKPDWMIGHDIFKMDAKWDTLRYINDPTLDGLSLKNARDYCPGVDPHLSSGIYNYAFYLLTMKEGWDVKTAFHVMIEANKLYWHQNSDFSEGACGAKNAAEDLGLNVDDVVDVFMEVGIEPCVPNHSGFNGQFHMKGTYRNPLKFDWFVPEGLDYLRLYTQGTWTARGDIDLHIKHGSLTKDSENSGSLQLDKDIVISNPPAGLYEITITTPSNFSDVLLYTEFYSVTIKSNISIASEGSMKFNFEVPEHMLKKAQHAGILVRLLCPENCTGYYHQFYVSYNEPVEAPNSLGQGVYDVASMYVNHQDSIALICKAQAGRYHGIIKRDEGGMMGQYLDFALIEAVQRQ